MYSFFDKDGKDDIDFTEFVLGCYEWRATDDKEKLKYIFEIFDGDRDGYISYHDIVHVIATLYINENLPSALAVERASLVFSVFSNDPEEKISQRKFIKMCKNHKELLEIVTMS